MHDSDFVTILICTTTTNPTTTKKGAELGKIPTQHSLTPFGQSWVVLARSQKTIRNLQVFFACKLDHRRPWFWQIVCAESPCRSAVVFFFWKHQVVLLSLQRTTHQYQGIWRWWWQTLFDPGVFSDNSLLWRISFTFCLLFLSSKALQASWNLSNVEMRQCHDPLFPAQPGTV